MIHVTKLGAKASQLVVNADLIETVEATPDTVITLTTGHKVIVNESVDEVVRRVIAYQRALRMEGPVVAAGNAGKGDGSHE